MSSRLLALDKIPGVRPVGVGEMWRQIFATFVLKVTGYRSTHACKDNQLCAGFKSGIGGAVNGAQYIWEANSTEENWDFYLLTQIMSLMK